MAKNYYEILGVEKTATADEIKAAYRKLAKKYHPDMYSTAPEAEKKAAEEKIKEINHAYEVLSDEQKRAAYDAYGDENGPQPGAGGFGGGFGVDMDDIFSTIFSGFGGGFGGGARSEATGRRKGRDITAKVVLTFEEAAFGVQRTISVKRRESCSACHGTGAKDGTAFKVCPQCGGRGQISVSQRTMFGMINTTTQCPTCHGTGKVVTEKCSVCGGEGSSVKQRDIKVNIPAGIDAGQRITYQGEGHGGANGGPNGALVVEISITPHKLFERRGTDVYMELPITVVDAALGCTKSIPTLYGKQELKIPEATQSGTVFKLRGSGIKKLRSDGKGDMYVKVTVEVPKSLSKEQKELLKKLAKSFEPKQHPMAKAYEEKL